MKSIIRQHFIYLLRLEWLILCLIAMAYWYPSPTRDSLILIILSLIPIYTSRILIHNRIWTPTPFDEFTFGFIALCLINIIISPYNTRGVIMIFRPLLGIAIIIYLVEYARQRRHLNAPMLSTTLAAVILGVVALTATQWSKGKTAFNALTSLLPSIDIYPGVEGLFNANEIAGGMVWIAPLVLGIAYHYHARGQTRHLQLASLAAGLIYAALILGQSFSALIGLVVGTVIVLTPRKWWRQVTAAAIAFIVLAQVIIMLNPSAAVQVASAISGRDNLNSLQHREAIWISAKQAILDHPFTGLGVAMYRDRQTWDAYPTPNFPRGAAAHAHNEILHIGTDLGVPGIIILLSWYIIAAYMLSQAQRTADPPTYALVAGVSGGLIAHAIYGLGDAIPLWDRFAFIFWWMLGLAAALYTLHRRQRQSD